MNMLKELFNTEKKTSTDCKKLKFLGPKDQLLRWMSYTVIGAI